MLTPSEEYGLRSILEDFSDLDLFSLADTVTKRLIYVRERNAAIQAIISSLEKPFDLLRRQKVTKKVLFSYLLKIKPFVSPECSKSDFMKMCLTEWRSIEDCKNNDYESYESNSNVTDVQPSNMDWLSAMGTQFALWFFPIYNTLQNFGPEHFWSDCKLMGELKTAQERKEVTVVGASEVVDFLRSLIVYDKFYFDANTSRDSVISEQDPHGLIRVLVSGVVHQMSNCIGLFDSFFGLVKNPAYNDNWKIKYVHMKIHVNSPRGLMPVDQLLSICQRA